MKLFQRREEKPAYLMIGLGNPGNKYRNNRHNIGFMIVDHLAERWRGSITKGQAKSLTMIHHLHDSRVILAKPQKFMNESGRSVAALLKFYKIPLERLIVIYDELDLPLGTIRMRPEGGTGGHRGMLSIQNEIHSQAYARMRVGIDRPPGRMDPAHYVLQDFGPDELPIIEIILDRSVKCLQYFIDQGIDQAMNTCNNLPQDL